MSSIGPELPPHLQPKRKRDDGDITDSAPPAKRTSPSSSPSSHDIKARRVVGPAPPPAPIQELPSTAPDAKDDEESSDDDYGPATVVASSKGGQQAGQQPERSAFDLDPRHATSEKEAEKPKRDDWMMMPPKQDDLSRVDPLRPRAKGFATGKSARDPGRSGADSTMWTESMEQKQKRLQDEVMGVERPSDAQKDVIGDSRRKAEERDKARQAQSHLDKQKSKSLYDQHQKSVASKAEDDPSKRAFSYEKDVAKGPKMGHAQKKEMLNRAADFGSKFSSGSYL